MPGIPDHKDIQDGDSFQVTEARPEGMAAGYDHVFLIEAERAWKRAEQAKAAKDSTGEAGATAAAVLCAAAACEARMSEYLAQQEDTQQLDKWFVDCVRNERDALKQWRLLLLRRVPDFAAGTSTEYLNLGCLFQLRNVIAHRSALIRPYGEWPKQLRDCTTQNRVPADTQGTMDWTSVAFLSKVAEWSATTAEQWLSEMDRLGIKVSRP